MRKIIIAIDGYSACGKSSTAKICAQKLGYTYIDTGAMYRATTLFFKDNFVDLTNPKKIKEALNMLHISFHLNNKGISDTFLNGLNVEHEIRKMWVSERVSEVSAIPEVRRHMVTLQQAMGKKKGIVMDGRDIGTVVFPMAELKIFMHADEYIRATRRQEELLLNKQVIDMEDIVSNLRKRDLLDSSRKEGPLKKADDAYLLDTSYMVLEEQVDYVINLAISKMMGVVKSESMPTNDISI